MPEEVLLDYQGSSEGAVRHWTIPYARLEDTTPTVSNPAAVLCDAPDDVDQVCGVILAVDPNSSAAIIDFTCGMVYRFQVRNVLTYGNEVEATWGTIDIGDFVYYDRSPTMPAGVYLSTSPLDNLVADNPFFAHVVSLTDADMALYPKGTAGVASTQTVGNMIRGAGAG